MKLVLHRSDYFNLDFDLQYRWYLKKAGLEVAERYLNALLLTLDELAMQPDLGRERHFRHRELAGIRTFRLVAPFSVHLIFYRHTETELWAERLMSGVRDLPRRLREPPDSAE